MKVEEFIHSKGADRIWVKHADGDAVPEIRCPWCQAEIVYNGNYFCSFYNKGFCNWALDHPVRREADRAICDALGIDYLQGDLMPLPDPHAGEPTVEIDRDKWKLYREAVDQMKHWEKEANRLKAELTEDIGDAYVGTVDGQKVVGHRPKEQYADSRLRKDYPDLTEHFMKWKTERIFDLEAFGAQHPDILKQYQIRAFVQLG